MGLLSRLRAISNRRPTLFRRGRDIPVPVDLERFLEAQSDTYLNAKAEIERGLKTGHWMWFIFPNWKGLGRSIYARNYAIESVGEAEAYLAHPVLGARLRKCSELLLVLEGRTAFEIFGTPDDLKLRSCMTLFAALSPDGSLFHQVLDRYYEGGHDPLTLEALRKERRDC